MLYAYKLSNINVQLYQSDTENIFDSIIDVVEERGNNPIDSSQMGLMGPFETINNSLGSLSVSGAMTCIASRTGGGKSSIGFFYNVYLAEKYNLPVLHLDAAEMTVEQLQMRAICCLSNGRIPLWAVKSGEWRKNPEFFRIIRDELWPRVKKIKIYYKNVGQFRRQELISYIRRFYYNKVGRGNHLLINWDYIKGLEAAGKNNQEYQEIGYQVGDMKSLVTDEITASIWTAVQANRGGISTGKDSKSLEDNESSIGLSDRIIQMCSNAFFLRWKTPDELFSENNQFGNLVFKSLKERELLGKNYEDFLMPVQTPDGRYVKNYFNLQTKNFHYTDICDYRTMLGKLGKSRAKIDSKKKNTYELDV